MSTEWLVIRGSGVVAFALLSAATIWGLLVSSKLMGRWIKVKPLTWFHESLGIGALLATLVHVLVLSVHDFLDFSWAGILVPGLSDWRPVAVTAGIGAFGVVLVSTSFYCQRSIGQKAWRTIHFASFGVFVTSLVRGVGRHRHPQPDDDRALPGVGDRRVSLIALRTAADISRTNVPANGPWARFDPLPLDSPVTSPTPTATPSKSSATTSSRHSGRSRCPTRSTRTIGSRHVFPLGLRGATGDRPRLFRSPSTKLDPDATRDELRGIEADLQAKLGPVSPAGDLMKFMCEPISG